MVRTAPDLFSYPPYWAECYGTAPFLPTTREEMDALGWDSCDVILVTGDAYVDHPSFGMAVMGRLLEANGFRVGIIAQPDWRTAEPFKELGEPNLYFGVTAGNMDSLINRYTADLRIRHDDAYTAGGDGGKRPNRAVIVYSQRCKEAYRHVPVVIGGIEASLRRIAQYDYWTNKVRRSVLIDSTADILLYGNAERAMVELTHRLAQGETLDTLLDVRGTTVLRDAMPAGFTEVDSTRIDWPGSLDKMPNPYEYLPEVGEGKEEVEPDKPQPIRIIPAPLKGRERLPETTYIRLPSYEKVSSDPVLYAHASRILHQESNPHNARAMIQRHGHRELWVNPPPIPLETPEMDRVFGLPYQRVPHPKYGNAKIPAYDMIRFSVNIMRGCFGGCTFCSITEHEGRVIQSRSKESVLAEIEDIRDKVPGFTGAISDLGGPTANMYHLNCKDPEIQASCRKLSCVYPTICPNLNTDHSPTTELYREARKIDGVHTISISSGLRYDLAIEDPEYVKELVTHHVGGYLKIAPEHSEEGTLAKMMKPGMNTYYAFKQQFDRFSKEAGKKQYLIPYFIGAHPGCEDEDMLSLAQWLKTNHFQVDQVQTFYPSPMSLATAMYHSDRNPLKQVTYKSEKLYTPKTDEERKIHKALMRYHDEENWPLLRQALMKMGRADLIGSGPNALVPAEPKNGDARTVKSNTRNERPKQKAQGSQWSGRLDDTERKPKASGTRKGKPSSVGKSGSRAQSQKAVTTKPKPSTKKKSSSKKKAKVSIKKQVR